MVYFNKPQAWQSRIDFSFFFGNSPLHDPYLYVSSVWTPLFCMSSLQTPLLCMSSIQLQTPLYCTCPTWEPPPLFAHVLHVKPLRGGSTYWQINHANSAYFRLFWGYFWVIYQPPPPPLDLAPPLFTYPGSTPAPLLPISSLGIPMLHMLSRCEPLLLLMSYIWTPLIALPLYLATHDRRPNFISHAEIHHRAHTF